MFSSSPSVLLSTPSPLRGTPPAGGESGCLRYSVVTDCPPETGATRSVATEGVDSLPFPPFTFPFIPPLPPFGVLPLSQGEKVGDSVSSFHLYYSPLVHQA